MSALQPISTVPRDGRPVYVTAEDEPEYLMRWNPKGFNPIASRSPGIWEDVRGAFTWSEDTGVGPTHWRPAIYESQP